MSEWREQLELDGQGAVYEQIKRALSVNIRSGDWAPGHRVPGEEDLANHFGAARMTVHRALRELTDEGLIIRRRRAGSFVALPPPPAAMLEIVDMSSLIPARGQHYHYECLVNETQNADQETAERMRIETGSPVQRILCRHYADEAVVELEERWINLSLLPEARTAAFDRSSPGAWLLSVAPWTEAEHTVSAANADTATAELLDAAIGQACLVLERRTFQAERVVTYARLTHPGDRHSMSERFIPGNGSQS